MNPLELQAKLAPLVGDDLARALCNAARAHKDGAGTKIAVPSWVLVRLVELIAERA